MARIMALDYGERRIGVALSDPMRIIASGHSTYLRQGLDVDLAYFSDLMEAEDVSEWVIGLPMNTDGSEGEMVARAASFAQALSVVAKKPFFWADETYSSLEADEILKEKYRDWKKRKSERDMIAAQIILRHFLEFGATRRPSGES